MIDINRVWVFTNFLANAYQTGAKLTPAQFNSYCPVAVNDVTRKYYGVAEKYDAATSSAPIEYERTQLITDYLQQLKKPKLLPITRTGEAVLPEDYLHFDSCDYQYFEDGTLPDPADEPVTDVCECHATPCTCSQNKTESITIKVAKPAKKTPDAELIIVPVEEVKSNMWSTYLKDPFRKPSKEYPIFKFNGKNKLMFAPWDLKQVAFMYIAYPPEPKWGFIINANGIEKYSAADSVNIELPAILLKEVAMGILYCLGINTREMPLAEVAQQFKASGL